MEKDIKILENYIYNKKETMKEILAQAIENLIKAYKNLEQIEQVHKETNGELRKRITKLEEINAMVFNSKVGVDLSFDDYIPKSKIKDKIEELTKEGNYKTEENPNGRIHFLLEPCDYKIQVLEELLKKE